MALMRPEIDLRLRSQTGTNGSSRQGEKLTVQLDRYISALLRRWYAVAFLAAVGLAASLVYVATAGTVTATTTVAVLDPAVTQSVTPGTVATAGTAQLTFGSVIQSRALASRVISRLGLTMPVEAMQGKISAKLATSIVPNVTPLYTIQVKDHDPDRAALYADTVVEEGQKLFTELSNANRSPAGATLDDREQQLRNDEASARADLQNQLTQGEAELDRLRRLLPTYSSLVFDRDQASLVVAQFSARETELQLQNVPAQLTAVQNAKTAANASLRAARDALSKFQRDNGIDELNANITAETGVVNGLKAELQGIAPASGALRSAQDLINAVEARKMELAITQGGTSSIQVKVLDPAFVPPSIAFNVLICLLATLLGVFAGLAAVYLLEYFDRSPRTAEDAAGLIGATVLLRMPEAY